MSAGITISLCDDITARLAGDFPGLLGDDTCEPLFLGDVCATVWTRSILGDYACALVYARAIDPGDRMKFCLCFDGEVLTLKASRFPPVGEEILMMLVRLPQV